MPHLLIGGTNDGKRVTVPSNMSHLQMVCNTERIPQFYGKMEVDEPSFQTEVYERKHMRGNSEEFEVFTIQGMTGDQIIERLIERYR